VRHPDLESAHDQRLEGDRMLFSSKRAMGSLEVRVLLKDVDSWRDALF
jgi:hypothetical protein